ncbi:hypothetical protein Acr_07g0008520 [Actinidia rufa]|uniref:Reverse transcriptase n=1 Tax=Actinidia rufa TaxID=165716 RepID=A0A7J0EW15_9ERIC|nr:hypothetical protein Acr_07g0008520 [Actinidia rufa]
MALLMEKLNHFGDCSGLKISFSKSRIFSAGICSSDIEDIMGITGFSQGSFPFRYLGIPVADSKVSIAQFSPLIDKILGYISAWAGAMLSYVGRTELGCKCSMNNRPLVAWKEVTFPKIEGGLGIRNTKAWNKALLCKTLWDIQAKKDSLWIQWVHQIYMKHSAFWEYRSKHEDSPLINQVMALG